MSIANSKSISSALEFLNKKLYNNFYAKTGSLDYVNGICGVTVFKNSKSFCLFINDKNKREKLDGQNSIQNERLRQGAKVWKRQTDKAIEESLLKIL